MGSEKSKNTNPVAVSWDDPTAGENLKKAIEDGVFYKVDSNLFISNHKHLKDTKENAENALLAYDGDEIENQDGEGSKGGHANLTTEDLATTSVAYSRSSFLSAGLQSSDWDWSVDNNDNGAIGFKNENGENYFN